MKNRVLLALLDFLGCKVLVELLVMMEKLDQLVLQVLWDHLVKRALLEIKEYKENLDNLYV